MQFRAKIDWPIAAALIASILVPSAVARLAHLHWMYAISICGLAFVFGFCFPQSYATIAQKLVIRAGLKTRSIPYAEITAVRSTADWGSALALSLDRIEVRYISGAVVIAVEDKGASLLK